MTVCCFQNYSEKYPKRNKIRHIWYLENKFQIAISKFWDANVCLWIILFSIMTLFYTQNLEVMKNVSLLHNFIFSWVLETEKKNLCRDIIWLILWMRLQNMRMYWMYPFSTQRNYGKSFRNGKSSFRLQILRHFLHSQNLIGEIQNELVVGSRY